MNLSKKSNLAAFFFVFFFLLVAFFQVRNHRPTCQAVYYPSEHPLAGELSHYSGLSRDASITYAPIITGEKDVTDWHSALYMYECRALLFVVKSLGVSSDGVRIQIVMYYLYLGILLAYASALFYQAIRNSLYLMMLFVPLTMGMSFLFDWVALGLDFFFFVHFAILCCSVAFLSGVKDRRMRALLWILIAVTLFHAVNFRKNAVLLIPFVVYVFVFSGQTVNLINYRKWFRWLSITMVVTLVTVKIVPWTLPVKSTNPSAPMLSSDLRIAAVLRGEQEQLRAEILKDGGDERRVNHEYCDSLTAYWGVELLKERVFIPHALDIYEKHWRQHFSSMLMSRFIQTVEFYCGGSFPRGQSLISRLYPALDKNPQAWKFLKSLPGDIMYGRLAVLLAGMLIAGWSIFHRWKKGRWAHPWDKSTSLALVFALVYAGSFAIVPPTADARYLAPCLFIIWNACWVWIAHTVNRYAKDRPIS